MPLPPFVLHLLELHLLVRRQDFDDPGIILLSDRIKPLLSFLLEYAHLRVKNAEESLKLPLLTVIEGEIPRQPIDHFIRTGRMRSMEHQDQRRNSCAGDHPQ